ncbi:hypothetical protein EJB05_34979 [Eragrostis curvula]|uniref:Uncharacterized protein n=1 Tax=Eragrostis curvula TaxID=38414 RepID=A0A5J9U5F5_9POAL|nr:hypothetical protein EJB05_34979 [Eragrostis curvula]
MPQLAPEPKEIGDDGKHPPQCKAGSKVDFHGKSVQSATLEQNLRRTRVGNVVKMPYQATHGKADGPYKMRQRSRGILR